MLGWTAFALTAEAKATSDAAEKENKALHPSGSPTLQPKVAPLHFLLHEQGKAWLCITLLLFHSFEWS